MKQPNRDLTQEFINFLFFLKTILYKEKNRISIKLDQDYKDETLNLEDFVKLNSEFVEIINDAVSVEEMINMVIKRRTFIQEHIGEMKHES